MDRSQLGDRILFLCPGHILALIFAVSGIM